VFRSKSVQSMVFVSCSLASMVLGVGSKSSVWCWVVFSRLVSKCELFRVEEQLGCCYEHQDGTGKAVWIWRAVKWLWGSRDLGKAALDWGADYGMKRL